MNVTRDIDQIINNNINITGVSWIDKINQNQKQKTSSKVIDVHDNGAHYYLELKAKTYKYFINSSIADYSGSYMSQIPDTGDSVSALLQISKNNYIYFQQPIPKQFTIKEKVLGFCSNLGNSEVPYSYCWTEKYYYFLDDGKNYIEAISRPIILEYAAKNNLILTDNFDLYSLFYGFEKHKIPQSEFIKIQISPVPSKADCCHKMDTKKYRERPGPPYPANEPCCQGINKIGNDGLVYISKVTKNGIWKWSKVTK